MNTGVNRLVMGTAQLGMDYGIANTQGRVRDDAALALVNEALQTGVHRFDTASHYGCSERVLGRALRALDEKGVATVTSKLDPAIDPADTSAVLHAVQTSVDRLGRPLDALLLHDETILDRWDTAIETTLQTVLDAGLTKHGGISVYSPKYALSALEKPLLSVLQIPGNAMDTRFEKAGVLRTAETRGVRLMVRSVFLQGLLTMDSESLPPHMAYAQPHVARYRTIATTHGMDPTVAAMAYVRKAFPSAHIIFGALNSSQLLQNVHAFEHPFSSTAYADFRTQLSAVPDNVLNPSLWPSAK
ncbi:NADP-dependent oxidoreductase [Pseudodesulfovibrio sp. JC047]|uniref:aldo/keto reductase n=1 Tax=Pseudodesulfovibrio sp. JC047 TaxID=2683199 RepID=UPI0013D7B9BB|nr:aldo/keto reductase [Pseudodesulfovibrio sp. JC047]NDV20639.1 NADP-dependent oxidoreductase [Pseudodesulfovibrio sp. JC047]